MKITMTWVVGGAASACMALTGCGDSGTRSSAVAPQALDTARVQALANAPADTTEPFEVNNGLVTVVPTDDETSDPMDVIGS